MANQITIQPKFNIQDEVFFRWLPSMGEILSDDDWNVLANH